MKTVVIGVQALRIAVWTIIAIAILGVSIAGSWVLINSKEDEEKEITEVQLTEVEIEVATVRTVEISLPTEGDVMPRRRTTLTAEVGGALTEVSAAFEAGEVFEEGVRLLQIDQADYEAALTSNRAALADAKLAVEMELARQEQSLRDWQKLGRGGAPSDLVKRIPQMASARAREAAAQSAVEKAVRDLERTEIAAPYACRIERTYVDVGAIVSPGMRLADVVSLGAVEVRLPISMEDYGYLQRDEEGRVTGKVTAIGRIGGEEVKWSGRLIRSDEIVDRNMRSVHVVAEFGTESGAAPPIGMFVEASIVGKAVPDIVAVSRKALIDLESRAGEEAKQVKQVILVTAENRLKFATVKVKRTESAVVLISEGLKEGDRVVVTPLSSPRDGMEVKVKVRGSEQSEPEGEQAAPVLGEKPS